MTIVEKVTLNGDGTFSRAGSGLGQFQPLGYAQVVLDAANAVSPAIPSGSLLALVRVEAKGMRYRDDGTDPTPTVGMPVMAGESMVYDATMDAVRVIGMEPGCILNVAFYGRSDA